jgi:NitT/TauT family transport system substrate-binding protein
MTRQMTQGARRIAVGVLAVLLSARAAGAADKVVVGLTSLAPAAMPMYAAKEKGFFEAEGLDVRIVVFRSGTENTQAVLANEVQIAFGSFTEVLQLQKAKQDARWFWGVANFMPFRLYARPEIKSGRDLKGKKLAVSRFGAQSDYLTQYTLRHFGVEPIKEAAIIQVGSTPARYAALKSGAVDATIMWFPQTIVADREGFRMLVDLNDLITEWGYLGYYAKADFLKQHRERVIRYLRAHTRGIQELRANPATGIDILRRQLKYDQDVAEAGYKEYARVFAEDGRLTIKGFEFLLEQEEKAGNKIGLKVADLIDPSFVEQLGKK